MSDELAIQPGLNPQIQQKKTSTVPYALGGAVAGGAIGGAINHYIQKPTSWEDIVKEAKDTTDFSSKTEPATWEAVKEKAKAVDDAKNALAEASKPQLEKNDAAQVAYDNAVKAKNDAWKKLYDEQKATLEKGNTTTSTIDSKKFKKFSDIPATDLPDTNVKSGKAFKGSELENLYAKLTNEVKNAETALDTKLNGGLRADKEIYTKCIKDSFNEAINDLAGKDEEKIGQYFAEKETGSWLSGKKPSKQYQRAIDIAGLYYPEPKNLTNEQYLQIGKELAKGEKPESGWLPKSVTVKTDSGRNVVKTYYYSQDEARKLLDSEIERVSGLRTAAADQIFAETQNAVSINSKLGGLVDRVGAEVPADVAKETGYFTAGKSGTADVLEMKKIVSEGKGDRAWTSPNGKTKLEGYAADIKKMEDAIAVAKKSGSNAVMPAKLNGEYTGATKVEEALKMAQNRNVAYKMYAKQEKELTKQLEETVKNNSIIEEYDKKIADIISGDKRVQKARTALTEQFPALFGEKTTTKLSTADVEKQAKEYADKNLKKSLQEAIDKAKGELDKAVGEKGKVNEELKKAAQEKLDQAEKALKEKAEELGKTTKKGGMNKWLAAGIGAGIGALALWGVAASKNKNE